jgi:hypothetical protein
VVRMFSHLILSIRGSLGVLIVLGEKRALAASVVWNMMGSWE